ncbi:MAG: penicillin-binding protein 2 [Firmicutes bacterium]|nr:penicillin-binding protein 2 [Bacillota bacterium]
MNRRIARLTLGWLLGCAVLALGTTYYQAVVSERLAGHTLNPRLARVEARVRRGDILDRNGKTIARSAGPGVGNREYVGPQSLAPLVGYSHPRFGKSGLEAAYDSWLLGTLGNPTRSGLAATLVGQGGEGNTIRLTIDLDVQEACERALSGRRGAAVALDATTGEVLAAASSPGFDPGNLDSTWEWVSTRADSPLLSRVTRGLYPPGSTIKIAVAAVAADTGAVRRGEWFECDGQIRAGGTMISEPSGAHGFVDLTTSIAVSCNTTFVKLALRMGQKLLQGLDRFFLSSPVPFDVSTAAGSLKPDAEASGDLLGQLAIGQGDLVVTPLHMAVIAAAVANDGVMMRPRLVTEILRPDGAAIVRTVPRSLGIPMSISAARAVGDGMLAAVSRGTARAAAVSGFEIAGKTGTAQNPHGPPHAWFTGYGASGGKRVAVAVVLENAGPGGTYAAPAGAAILREALGGR